MAVARMALSAADGTTVLTVATVESGPVTVVSAAGELDMDTAGRFTRHVDRLVSVDAPELVIVDLGEVEFLGAAGITTLLAGVDSVQRGGGLLRLRRLSRPALLALKSSHTLDLFDIEEGTTPAR
jgi:anti-sigma B factor antagonist